LASFNITGISVLQKEKGRSSYELCDYKSKAVMKTAAKMRYKASVFNAHWAAGWLN